MTFKRDEVRTLVAVGVGFPTLIGIGWGIWGSVVTIPALTLIFVGLLGIVLGSVRRLRGELEDTLRQIQGLLFLQTHLKTEHPLPALGGAALFPDSAAMLVGLINQQRPQLIVELGSGVSTLVCAHALRQLGSGRIISLDHSEHYATITREHLKQHGLEEFAEVRDAPIEPTNVDGQTWHWYALSQLSTDQPIDLLIVDGPPRGIQDLARYPAARVLFDRLSAVCTILLDDTHRADEREIVRRWKEQLPDFDVTELPSGKGATVFRRAA